MANSLNIRLKSTATPGSSTTLSVPISAGDIQFSDVIIPDATSGSYTKGNASGSNVGAPGSRMKRMKKLLEETEKKQKRLQEWKQKGGDGLNKYVLRMYPFLRGFDSTYAYIN